MNSPVSGPREAAAAPSRLAPQVKNIIPVASGKGGVGKSTVSANLAMALAWQGARVGLMDADVYGPSIPSILGITEPPKMEANRILPAVKNGVKVISMAFFIPANEAVIWRGPMLHKMVQDFLGLVEWGELDYLIVDLPPGTGDIQLSLCQSIPVTGAVIVSTPQELAWNVAHKAIVMFDKLNAPVLGVIENMSGHACSECGHVDKIFGAGGARKAAERLEIPFLGEIPLATELRIASDEGSSITESSAAVSEAFKKIAKNLTTQIETEKKGSRQKPVPVKISAPGQPQVRIAWSDGHESAYEAKDLRLACPCAACVDEVTGKRILTPDLIPKDIRALQIAPVGRYALHIQWSDGHATGLYGYEMLRKIS